MAKHVCCITTSLLGVDVDFTTRVASGHTYTAEQSPNVDYLTAIRPILAEVRQKRPPNLLETFTKFYYQLNHCEVAQSCLASSSRKFALAVCTSSLHKEAAG